MPDDDDALAAVADGVDANTAKIKTKLIKALSTAHQAISADIEGDRATAITLYEEATQQLEEIIPFVPSGHAKVMAKYSSAYANRLHELEELSNTRRKDKAFRVPNFPIHFVDRPIPTGKLPDTPVMDIRRPFWLMRLFSLTLQTGTKLTPTVYVPRDVWVQDGAHSVVKALSAKTRYCEQIVDLLSGFQCVDKTDQDAVAKQLDQFLSAAEGHWKALSKELPSIATASQRDAASEKAVGASSSSRAWSNFNKFRTRMVDPGNTKKTEATVAYNSYLPWLLSVLETSQVVEAWVVFFERSGQTVSDHIWQRLYRVAAWFYCGLCSFVLRDMLVLLVRYMRKARESYSRLFPPHFLASITPNKGS